MPVRFQVTRPHNDDRQILSDVPPPSLPDYRRCGLAQALTAALSYCGQRVEYSFIMGLTGLAFAISHADSFAEQAPLPVPFNHVTAALRALGYEGQIIPDTPALPPEQVVAMVSAEIDAGRPVISHGWGPAPPGWAVITGYSRSHASLHGYLLAAEPQPLHEASAHADLIVCLGKAASPVPPPEAVREVIVRAADLWSNPPPDTGPAAYHNLLALLTDEPLFHGPTADAAISAHETLIATLIDSRAAAIDFLQTSADLFPPIPAAWLQRAADCYTELVDLLETRTPPVFDALATDALTDPQWRQQWIERMGQVAELDMEASHCLRRSLSADFPPTLEKDYEC